jgi:hypothetical protein
MKSPIFLLLLSISTLAGWAYPDYYQLEDRDKAQAEARQRMLPLVWLVAFPNDLTKPTGSYLTRAYITQMALTSLEGRAVIITADANQLGSLPALIQKEVRTNERDDVLKNPRVYYPKLIFTNPEATKSLGRVSCRQLVRERDVEINVELLTIGNDPIALAKPTAEEIAASASTPDAPTTAATLETTPTAAAPASSWSDILLESSIGVCIVVIFVIWMRVSARSDPSFRP